MTRADVARKARELDEREMSPAEFNRLLQAVLSDEAELQERAALIGWFRRRYPTVAERFAYVRKKMREIRESPLGASDQDEADRGLSPRR